MNLVRFLYLYESVSSQRLLLNALAYILGLYVYTTIIISLLLSYLDNRVASQYF
jgi:hypothetical protein